MHAPAALRAVIYARKSTDDPNAESTGRQVARSHEAAVMIGASVITEYVDEGISGAEFVRRPGVLRLLEDGRRGLYDIVIMSEYERLGRDTLRAGLMLRELYELGIRVYYYLSSEFARLDSPEHRMLATLRGFSSEMERERAKQRTRDALLSRARRGLVTGGAVYGYRNVPVYAGDDSSGNPVRSHVTLAIDPDEAKVVRGIFRMRADGYGIRRIARTLNGDSNCEVESERYFGGRRVSPPRKGSGSWAPGCIHAMLKNERYLGRVTWGRFRNTDRAGRTRLRVAQDPSSWVRLDLPELRIVSEDAWKQVRGFDRGAGETEQHRSGRGMSGNRTPSSLLSGLAACAVCRGPMRVAGSWKANRSYGCGYHNDRGATVCDNNLFESVHLVDRRLLEEIEANLLVPEARRYTLERAVEIVRQKLAGAAGEIEALRTKFARVSRELENLLRGLESGNAPESVFERIRSREAEKAAVQAELAKLEELAQVPDLDVRRIDRLIGKHVAGLGEWLRSDLVTARAALRKILTDRVLFHPTVTKQGERTYLLEASLTLGNLVPRADRMTVSVPDGIWH